MTPAVTAAGVAIAIWGLGVAFFAGGTWRQVQELARGQEELAESHREMRRGQEILSAQVAQLLTTGADRGAWRGENSGALAASIVRKKH